MLLVPCPNCGPRNSADLRWVAVAHERPDPSAAGRTEWRDHLYMEPNPAGWVRETWYCRLGCRRYITLERHTVTNRFRPATSDDAVEGDDGPTT